jgi:beta-xylosidase
LDPPQPYAPGCSDLKNGSDPYGYYHVIQAYSTTDFTTWNYLGEALPLRSRAAGELMRPHVVYNNVTRQFVLWYEDRPESGYSVATSQNPGGPFKTIHSNISMPGTGRIGDFDLFVDNDGVAYHIRTGFDIVQLDSTYTGVDQLVSSFKTPESTEAPILFRRDDMYYAFVGRDCCYCLGGSNVFWLTASSIRGPWTLRGDVGSNPGPFDPHSPNNYVTRGQGQKVFPVHTRSGPMM